MKALVKAKAERGLWLEDIAEPAIGINDVLIRVHYTGICGTDVHIYEWDDWAQKTIPIPMAIGHEFVGEIVEVGSNVNDFHPGDIVSGEGHVVCGRCRNCLAGRRHLCAHTLGVGVNRPGAFAQFIALPGHHIHGIVQHPLDDEITELAHQHVRLGKMPQGHGERAHVVVVAMGEGDGIQFPRAGVPKQGQSVAPLALGMHAGVQQQAVVVHLHQPGAGTDGGVRIEIDDIHD